jgi:SAM-dependent methyltransferase
MDFDTALAKCLASAILPEDREYARFHANRFRYLLETVAQVSRPGASVANVGLSCFDLIAVEVLADRPYASLVPTEAYVAQFPDALYGRVPKAVFDALRDGPPTKERYDVVILADVLEHLFSEDEPVIDRVKSILKPDGVVVVSLPNAMRHVNRVRAVLGQNIFLTKHYILHGVYGGYGHIREYSVKEVRDLLTPRFQHVRISGLNPYGTPAQRRAMNLLPLSMRSTILAVASGPRL